MGRVAVIGAGPSGFYAAQALLQADPAVQVDLIDRMPAPFGLVRSGVAPDHQKIKSVVKAYERIAASPGCRFFGNVALGRDVSIDELLARYDQVVLAVGAQTARKMGIPGEDLPGSFSATEFVAWYNGHPDYQDRSFPLDVSDAVVVGVGNVAMDVTRILVSPPERLHPTDITSGALGRLAAGRRERVHVLGRRGPAQAAFTPKELQEIAAIDGVDVRVRDDEAALDPASAAWLEASGDRMARENAEFVASRVGARASTARSEVWLRFCRSPVEILGDDRVRAVRVEKTALIAEGDRIVARGTGVFEEIPAGLVLAAVGYLTVPLPGVPYDEVTGRIPNDGGQVVGPDGPVPDLFVVGWAKRGPTGLIGTNRADSAATVARMLETGARRPADGADPADWLASRVDQLVTWRCWQKVDAAEVARGRDAEKIREKFTAIEEMLGAVRDAE